MIVAGHLYKCNAEITINPDCIPGLEETVWKKNRVYKCFKNGTLPNELKRYSWRKITPYITDCFEDIGEFNISQAEEGEIWTNRKNNKDYAIVSVNAKMKSINTGNWMKCVTYKPLCEDDTEMFSMLVNSFHNEFVRKNLSE